MTTPVEVAPPALPAPEQPAVAPRACVFRLGATAYAVPVGQVREVAMLPRVTPVPRMPAQVRGVANLRGLLLPVVDPAALLGHAATPLAAVTPTVVLRHGAQDVGLAVDAIDGLLPMDLMIATPDGLPAEVAPLAEGAFLSAGRPVVLLDAARLLAALRPLPIDTPFVA